MPRLNWYIGVRLPLCSARLGGHALLSSGPVWSGRVKATIRACYARLKRAGSARVRAVAQSPALEPRRSAGVERPCASRRARDRSAGGRCGTWAPRVSLRASAQARDQPARAGADLRAGARGPRRVDAAPPAPTARTSWRRRPRGLGVAKGSRSRAAPASRLAERGARGAGAEHEALAERIGRESVGAMQAGAR